MMKYLFTVLILINTVFPGSNLKMQKSMADSLYETGSYFDAVTEYKRLRFFDSNNTYSFYCNYKIGLCYKEGAKFDQALSHLAKAYFASGKDEEKFAAKEQMMRINILRRTTAKAHQLLNELANSPNYRENNIYYWRGWIYMFEDRWDLASLEFGKIDSEHELKKLCESVNNEKYSVNLAKIISLILPGSGQFYTGNYLSGIMSLGWNFLWGYTTINAFIEKRIFDGIMTGNLLWLRFYRGNYQNAEKFAEQENFEIINETYRYLQNSYEGLKP